MESVADTALGALFGVLLTALVAAWNARRTYQREIVTVAIEAARVDFGAHHERAMKEGGGAKMLPLHVFVHWHLGVAKLAATGTLDPRRLDALKKENSTLIAQCAKWDAAVTARAGHTDRLV